MTWLSFTIQEKLMVWRIFWVEYLWVVYLMLLITKKELDNVFHRFSHLDVWLEELSKIGFMVFHNSKSSLGVEVKSKQHIDTLMMVLKE